LTTNSKKNSDMNQGPRCVVLMKKNGGGKFHATVPLRYKSVKCNCYGTYFIDSAMRVPLPVSTSTQKPFLKVHLHRIFYFCFFHQKNLPGPLIYNLN
jgi:hypothetical protein